MPFKKKSQLPLTFFSLLLAAAIIFYGFHIYSIQVVNAAEYTDKNDGAASVRTAVLKAPRGEILDCYGITVGKYLKRISLTYAERSADFFGHHNSAQIIYSTHDSRCFHKFSSNALFSQERFVCFHLCR